MAVTIVGTGTSDVQGVASATALNVTPAMPANLQAGDRVFVTISAKGGSILAPGGWKTALAHSYPGLGLQPEANGDRIHAIFYRDWAPGWPAQTFIAGADFSGQTAAVGTAMAMRKGANEEWQEPYVASAKDTTANTTLSASLSALPIRPTAKALVLDTSSTPLTLSSPGLNQGVNNIALTLARNQGTTLGDDVVQILYHGNITTSGVGTLTHSGTLSLSRVAEVAVVVQDIIDKIDDPIVERVTAYENKFDPRAGNTGNWLGADCARSIPRGDGTFIWIFADTFWRTSGTGTPTNRLGYQFQNSSIGFQSGPDLATATVTFHKGPGGVTWFPVPGGTHYAWPIDGIFIGNDLYVFSQRILSSNPMGAEYGWTVHRIPNAKTTNPSAWPQATFLYQSADTGLRPLFSAYDGGDDYIYVWGIARNAIGNNPAGWRYGRWLKTNLTGTNQAAVEWWDGEWFSTGEANSKCVAENPYVSEGSVHRRPIDGRWITTEGNGYGKQDVQMRLTQDTEATYGTYIGWGTQGFRPPPPGLQPGDYAISGGFSGKILSVNADGSRVMRWLIDGTYGTATLASLTPMNRTDRFVYRNPRMDPIPEYANYACKSHPDLQNTAGLIATYADNSSSAALETDLSVYWPKFIRVKAPEINNFAFNSSTGTATWSVTGSPDIQAYTVNGGPWTTIDPMARTLTVAPNSTVTLLARGLGGDNMITSSPTSKVRVGVNLPTRLYLGANVVNGMYLGTNKL